MTTTSAALLARLTAARPTATQETTQPPAPQPATPAAPAPTTTDSAHVWEGIASPDPAADQAGERTRILQSMAAAAPTAAARMAAAVLYAYDRYAVKTAADAAAAKTAADEAAKKADAAAKKAEAAITLVESAPDDDAATEAAAAAAPLLDAYTIAEENAVAAKAAADEAATAAASEPPRPVIVALTIAILGLPTPDAMTKGERKTWNNCQRCINEQLGKGEGLHSIDDDTLRDVCRQLCTGRGLPQACCDLLHISYIPQQTRHRRELSAIARVDVSSYL